MFRLKSCLRQESVISSTRTGLLRLCRLPLPGKSRSVMSASGTIERNKPGNSPQCRVSRISPRRNTHLLMMHPVFLLPLLPEAAWHPVLMSTSGPGKEIEPHQVTAQHAMQTPG